MRKVGKDFIKGTQYPDYSTVDLVLRVPEPPHELPAKEGQTIIKLPNPKKFKVPDFPVRKAIEHYEPVGFFSRSSITLKDLSYMLWCTQGFKKIVAETIQCGIFLPAVQGTRWRRTLWHAKWKGLRPVCTGTSRNPTVLSQNGSTPA